MTTDQLDVVIDDARLLAPADVGVLSRESRGRVEVVRFAYTPAWLESATAYAIDPELPLVPGEQFPGAGRSLFGVFRDTSPDRWGRVLMERREALDGRRENRKPRRLGEWAFLLGVSDVTRMGAIRLRDRGETRAFRDQRVLGVPPATRLRELEAIVRALDEPGSEALPEYDAWLRQLVAPGSSLGGARPKATFTATDGALWIAKFPGRQDRYDVGSWELLAHELAQRAKIRVPDATQIELGSEHHTFTVRRFDRDAGRRRMYASATTLLVRDDGDALSYLDIAQAIQDQGDPETIEPDLAELYRRVLFNVLIGNRDDHSRNHGFLRGSRGWSLAPAFDVNPNPDKAEHALTLDESSAIPSVRAIRATRDYYRLSAAAAARIEKQVRAAFQDWQSIASRLGIPRREIGMLENVIDPTLDA